MTKRYTETRLHLRSRDELMILLQRVTDDFNEICPSDLPSMDPTKHTIIADILSIQAHTEQFRVWLADPRNEIIRTPAIQVPPPRVVDLSYGQKPEDAPKPPANRYYDAKRHTWFKIGGRIIQMLIILAVIVGASFALTYMGVKPNG